MGGSRSAAAARTLAVFAAMSTVPVLRRAVELVTPEPQVEEILVADAPTTLVRPGRARACATLVLINGVTVRGRRHPDVQRLARALARAGYAVLVPDLAGLAHGEITERTLAAAVAVGCAAADRRETREGRVGLLGVSIGASLALLAAEDERLAGRVSAVSGVAPCTNFVNVIRLATTGTYPSGGALEEYPVPPFLGLVVARSLAGALPDGDRELLRSTLVAVQPDAADPLAPLRDVPRDSLSKTGLAVVDLLMNRDARRFDRLYSCLTPELRAVLTRLSPLAGVGRLRASAELASAPRDKYFPAAESYALAGAASGVRVTVTSALAHADPAIAMRDMRDLARFWAFATRTLRAFAV